MSVESPDLTGQANAHNSLAFRELDLPKSLAVFLRLVEFNATLPEMDILALVLSPDRYDTRLVLRIVNECDNLDKMTSSIESCDWAQSTPSIRQKLQDVLSQAIFHLYELKALGDSDLATHCWHEQCAFVNRFHDATVPIWYSSLRNFTPWISMTFGMYLDLDEVGNVSMEQFGQGVFAWLSRALSAWVRQQFDPDTSLHQCLISIRLRNSGMRWPKVSAVIAREFEVNRGTPHTTTATRDFAKARGIRLRLGVAGRPKKHKESPETKSNKTRAK